MATGIDFGIGINWHYSIDGRNNISCCILALKKGVITLIDSCSGLSSMEEVERVVDEYVKKEVRINLNVSGRAVLLRPIARTLNEQEQDYEKLLPGIKRDEFLLQRVESPEVIFFSLLRKRDIPLLTAPVSGLIYSVSLGATVVNAILPFYAPPMISACGYLVTVKDNQIANIDDEAKVEDTEIEISGQKINSDCLFAYSAAIQLFLPAKEKQNTLGLSEAFEKAPERYKIRKNLFVTGRAVLLVVLCVLVLRTLLYFVLTDRIDAASATLMLHKGRNQKDGMELQVNAKMIAAYDDMGWSLNRKPLFYTDQLAKTVPSEIRLSELEVGVFDEALFRKEKYHRFKSDQIRVSGISEDPAVLSRWLSVLEVEPWIKVVTDQKYQHDNRIGKGVFEFTIKLR